MIPILITGSNGQLGSELQYLLKEQQQWLPVFTDQKDLDIRDTLAVDAFFKKYKFKFCINCAAYTAVDKAEIEKELAYQVNAEAVEVLANICKANQTFLIHISSDYVYHNGSNGPIKEEDDKSPKSIYAKSKLAGEESIRNINPQHVIFRSSWIYSSFGHNFIKTMLRLGSERKELNVVSDQIGVPTYARDLASVIIEIMERLASKNLEAKYVVGTYNYCNEGISSWFEFAKLIMTYKNIDCQINPIPSSSYPTPAPRPFNSHLDLAKFHQTFGIKIPNWEESAKKVLDML